MSVQRGFIETSHGKFHYEAAGTGKPMLLIHGGTASAREWRQMLEGLGQHAYCVAIDRLGCGASDRSRDGYSRETLTKSLLACADALGFDHFGVIGQSYGGFWSLSLAFAAPERISRMVLVNSAGGPLTEEDLAERRSHRHRPPPATSSEEAARQLEAALDGTIKSIFADPSRVPATYREDLRWQMEQADPSQMNRASDEFARMSAEDYSKIKCPTLVVWGEADSMIPTSSGKRLAAAIPGARFAGIPGSGHTCQIETPAEFVAIVGAFLDETVAIG